MSFPKTISERFPPAFRPGERSHLVRISDSTRTSRDFRK
jgi:hypothetical protein